MSVDYALARNLLDEIWFFGRNAEELPPDLIVNITNALTRMCQQDLE